MNATNPNPDNFDPDWASNREWAQMYRRRGLQVVAARYPMLTREDKRPQLSQWRQFQTGELVSDAVFDSWFPFNCPPNMGLITGSVSGRIAVVDLDDYKGGSAGAWWREATDGIEPETWTQVTGGGGRQYFFEVPEGVQIGNCRTAIGVDIRGQGGFAMLPPSQHMSRNSYAWAPGCGPWEVELDTMPARLLEAIMALFAEHGGGHPSGPSARTASPQDDYDVWGNRVDGREDFATRLVWRKTLELYREAPIIPPWRDYEVHLKDWFETIYLDKVKARHPAGLEAEGRGWSMFLAKGQAAYRQWDGKVAEEAAKPPPEKDTDPFADKTENSPENQFSASRGNGQKSSSPQAIKTFRFYDLMTEDVAEEPDLIEPGFASAGNFVLIAGPPKAQKSFLLQEMLVACATGGKFLCDTFTVPRPLRVFYLQAEMNEKVLRRRARAIEWVGLGEKALLRDNFVVSDRFHMILNEQGVKTTVETIKAAYPNEPPDVIGFDPLANLFDKENENDNAQLMAFLTGRMERVRQLVNPMALLVLVHHATKRTAEDMERDPFVCIRGAGALRGYYDSAIVIHRKGQDGKTRKVHFEMRSGEAPDAMEVEFDGGRFRLADRIDGVDKPLARKMLAEIDRQWHARMPYSMSPNAAGRYVGSLFCRKFGPPVEAVMNWVNGCLASGVLSVAVYNKRTGQNGLCVTGTMD